MRVRRQIAALCCAVAIAATVAPAGAHGRDPFGSRFLPGHVLVDFEPGAPRASILSSISGHIERTIPVIGTAIVQTPLPIGDAVARLRATVGVRYAEPDVTGNVAATPNDTCMVGCQATVSQWN